MLSYSSRSTPTSSLSSLPSSSSSSPSIIIENNVSQHSIDRQNGTTQGSDPR